MSVQFKDFLSEESEYHGSSVYGVQPLTLALALSQYMPSSLFLTFNKSEWLCLLYVYVTADQSQDRSGSM